MPGPFRFSLQVFLGLLKPPSDDSQLLRAGADGHQGRLPPSLGLEGPDPPLYRRQVPLQAEKLLVQAHPLPRLGIQLRLVLGQGGGALESFPAGLGLPVNLFRRGNLFFQSPQTCPEPGGGNGVHPLDHRLRPEVRRPGRHLRGRSLHGKRGHHRGYLPLGHHLLARGFILDLEILHHPLQARRTPLVLPGGGKLSLPA